MKTLLRWAGRILLAVTALILLLFVLAAIHIAYDANFGANAADVANTTYTDSEGNTLQGYLALPQGDGPHPSILLIHEWWGLNEGMTILADALAAEGYVVFAPDVYQNQVTSSFIRAIWLRVYAIPTPGVEEDVDSALAHLLS